MKHTLQTMCMLCPARITVSVEGGDLARAAADLDELAAGEGWKAVGDSDVCKTCGEAAARAFGEAMVAEAKASARAEGIEAAAALCGRERCRNWDMWECARQIREQLLRVRASTTTPVVETPALQVPTPDGGA